MREFLKDWFYISNSKKIAEKAMLLRIALSVMGIIACLVAMSITAMAFFSFNISSGNNLIKTAAYSLDIIPPADMTVGDSYFLDNSTEGTEKIFEFRIKASPECSATVGYCKINIKTDKNAINDSNDVQVFYTEPIWAEKSVEHPERKDELTVKIAIKPYKTATVSFVEEWGSCAYDVVDGIIEPLFNPLVLADNNEKDEQDNTEQEKQETEISNIESETQNTQEQENQEEIKEEKEETEESTDTDKGFIEETE